MNTVEIIIKSVNFLASSLLYGNTLEKVKDWFTIRSRKLTPITQ